MEKPKTSLTDYRVITDITLMIADEIPAYCWEYPDARGPR